MSRMPTPALKLENRQILIAEDVYVIAVDVADALTAAGATVKLAQTVKSALDQIKATEFDGAILDIRLGPDLVYPVADELSQRRVSYVFASGFDQQAVPKCYGHVPFYAKPLNMPQIISGLAALTARRFPRIGHSILHPYHSAGKHASRL